MLNTKSFLAVDFGAGSLKLAEFEVNEAGGLRLKQYGIKSLGAEGSQESTREATIQKALQEMMAAKGIKAKNVNVCAPGFHVFSKFVKLPPVDANKVTQIIQYEAQQNVPFPLAEVVWDYQILGSTPGGELEVLLVANQAAISKIARQFMTRLHIQVNQTMQFYRGQQGGSAPQRLFLSGGASIMPYTAQFFAEKLNVPVEYFNPLRNVQIDPSINLEELARVAHSMGEVVGLGLRNLAQCPVELNLMPDSTLKWQSFNQKKPYLVASVFSMEAVEAAIGLLFDKLASAKNEALEALHKEEEPREKK